MNKIIVFSPVGGTDPISSTNCRDGSMLHICRAYKPDVVYLYMSSEMLAFQEKDDRYRYCLNKLCELQHREMEIRYIERNDLKDVQKFDYFYEDFRTCIQNIYKEIDETDQLLINVSSGTPAMKSGLLVLTTLGEFPCKSIQVSTPERSINEHIHKGYDVETLWELNEDNQEDFENRCEQVQCPTLSLIKNEEIIKKHLQAYDYSAAVEVARSLPCEKTEKYIDMILLAEARFQLDFRSADVIANKIQWKYSPIQSGNERIMFEYALNLDAKRKRKDYVDFIRGLTPLFADLFERILKYETKVNVDDYRYPPHPERWDRRRLSGTNVEEVLLAEYPKFDYGNIGSVHLLKLIQALTTRTEVVSLVEELRDIEVNIRNQAAHEIVSVTEDKIRNLTGFTSSQIMEKVRRAFTYAGIRIKKEFWESYELMNEKILERIDTV